MKFQNLFEGSKLGTTYLEALNAMEQLLASQNETHWRRWIQRDIDEWQNGHSASHHLSAYGGMGSFSDFGFENPWINYIFSDLQSVCYFLAHQPSRRVGSAETEAHLGSVGSNLQGWCCLDCGYKVVSDFEIENFIAFQVIRMEMLKALAAGQLVEFVKTMVEKPPGHEIFNSHNVAIWAQHSGIHLRHQKGWLRPCPECQSNNTAVYRWVLSEKGGLHFEASLDNLPLRNRS